MGAVFEKIVTYYDIRIIRLRLEALLSRMGKRRRFPDIEQDRDIQTREDKLGFCEKRYSLRFFFCLQISDRRKEFLFIVRFLVLLRCSEILLMFAP